MPTNFDISELEEVDNSNLVELPEEKKAELNLIKEPLKDYSKVYDYNEVRTVEKNILIDNLESHKVAKSSQVNEIVLGILCVFIPPLAVFLYENSITTNFWVDLIGTLLFWLPGIILAFLIVFGGVSF
ncbi:MAG: YqaE/Pmp3 family membrane protein [Flavobacteriales bacterium]|nr:YqaE/Pmp3 family membrane protein [Flavobacteriales bacterium]